jgi:hypothetical protein
MHFIPAFGFVAARALPERSARAAVIAFSIAFAGLIAFTFIEALAGLPILPRLW